VGNPHQTKSVPTFHRNVSCFLSGPNAKHSKSSCTKRFYGTPFMTHSFFLPTGCSDGTLKQLRTGSAELPNDEGCDTTADDSSTAARPITTNSTSTTKRPVLANGYRSSFYLLLSTSLVYSSFATVLIFPM
jgi:hypothetical protein